MNRITNCELVMLLMNSRNLAEHAHAGSSKASFCCWGNCEWHMCHLEECFPLT